MVPAVLLVECAQQPNVVHHDTRLAGQVCVAVCRWQESTARHVGGGGGGRPQVQVLRAADVAHGGQPSPSTIAQSPGSAVDPRPETFFEHS